MSRPAIESITWIDSINRAGWVHISEVEEYLETEECLSAGYVVAETEAFLYLATTVTEGNCLSPVAIPQESILDRIVLVDADEEDEDE